MRSTAPMAGLLSLMAAWAFAAVSPAASADRYDALAARIIQTTGVKGGLVVHLGCGDGRLTAALHMNDRYVVHGLDSDAGNVEKARAHIRSLGLYGEVCVQQWQEAHLPYADNLINLVVWEKPGEVTMREVRRVLAPGGVAYIRLPGRWTKSVKPRPHDIDEWTHHLHGPDGNPVANDSVVGRPRRYQWVAGPLWLRSHDTDSSVDAVVTAGGRIFYIIDEGPISLPGDHPLPDKWRLVARDAFNGVLLWKVPIPQWGWRQWKDSWFANRPDNLPVNLPRRLVAVGDKVYVTLGYHAPVSQLDAATGKLLQTYEGTHDTREILLCEGVLILSVYTNGRLKVVAVNADTGRRLWQSKGTYAGSAREYFPYWRDSRDTKVDPALNPAADGKVVCIIDGRDIVCLDFHTGDELWRQKVEQKESASSVGSLLVRDGVVVHGKRNELVALSASTGKRLWSHPKREFGWLWFQWKDVFVIGGLVWTWSADVGQETFEWRGKPYRARWPVSVNGYDLHTGELKKQVHVGNIFKAPHHHRCYRNKATVRYVIASRRGSEFVDLLTGKHTVDNWVRGTCHLGMMPANGLLYAPPHPCVCYANEKLNGFMALAPGPQFDEGLGGPTAAPRLERGPAYGRVEQGGPTTGADDDWPTYRHDAMRSGATRAAVPDRLTHRWSVRVGDRLSPPTVGGERLFVSSIDEHRVAALSVEDGKTLWEFTASARVDTPPTLYLGTVLFGSADGWVYCLRASDGRIVWRFRAAPDDRLIGAFGQIESAWPVHGSVLVQDGLAYVVAGRSSHLDGGIWLYALDARTGRLVHQARLRGPQTNFDSFEHNFNPPQGALSDVLQGDGQRVYMRNLAFDPSLNEEAGDGDRITTVGGFLDDTYFKRAPWRFGRGSNWGRLISYDEDCVYVVRMFDTLQCLVPDNYFTPGKRGYEVAARPRRQFSQVSVANSDSLNPAGKALTVEAWVNASGKDGVILARGGANHGYALVLKSGRPRFVIRVTDKTYGVTAAEDVVGRWTHIAGVLTRDRLLQVYVNGALAASAEVPSLLVASPGQATQIGADAGTAAGDYQSPFAFTGIIDEVRIYHRALSATELREHCARPGGIPARDPNLVLCFTFDDANAADESGNGNDGEPKGTETVEGKSGRALRFAAGGGRSWSLRIPVRVRAMVATKNLILVAGPPDVVDPKDPLGAFEGRKGGLLWALSRADGRKLAEYRLDSPPVFNGMAAAGGRLYVCMRDGRVLCMEGRG